MTLLETHERRAVKGINVLRDGSEDRGKVFVGVSLAEITKHCRGIDEHSCKSVRQPKRKVEGGRQAREETARSENEDKPILRETRRRSRNTVQRWTKHKFNSSRLRRICSEGWYLYVPSYYLRKISMDPLRPSQTIFPLVASQLFVREHTLQSFSRGTKPKSKSKNSSKLQKKQLVQNILQLS